MEELDNQAYVQSQYGASSTIKQLLYDFRENIKPGVDIDVFYKNIMNIETASGIGLDIWGRILNASRNMFLENGTPVELDDTHFRQFLIFKALANICDASMATLNQMAMKLYDDNSLIVVSVLTQDTLPSGDYYNTTPMRVRWTWRANDVTNLERALFSNGIILCLAAGVGWTVAVISKDPLFGFAGSKLQPFNQGAFGVITNLDTGSD